LSSATKVKKALTSPFGEIQSPKKRGFLTALVESGGNVTEACKLTKISQATPYTRQWLDDEQFQQYLRAAKLMAAEHLEAEAIRRAYHGVDEPVGFYKGEPSAYVRRYSDVLLIFLLKGAMKHKYADRHELTGKDGGAIEIDTNDVRESLARRIAGVATRVGAVAGDPATNGSRS